MRPRTLRELTELARDEMSPTDEERTRVYDSLCAALAAGAAGAAVLGASTTASAAASTTAAASTAAASTAATPTAAAVSAASQGVGTGALVQGGGALVGGLSSSGLLLKGLVLIVALGGGAGLLSVADVNDDSVAEHNQGVNTEEIIPLQRAANLRIEAPPEAALIEPTQALGSQHLALPALRPRLVGAPHVENPVALTTVGEASAENPSERPLPELSGNAQAEMETDATLTLAARRLQHAQQAMARGDGASTLELLADDVDPRLRAERLALRVLALCQLGDERNARRDAEELRALDEPSSAALARIANSCVSP